jgi:polysaccharide pyruvyl transferase WcaK-like protein
MRLDLPYDLWQQFTKPIIFYGISYRHWQQQPFFHQDKLLQALEFILSSNNFLFSVRNDGTRQWLMNLLGISGEHIHEVPDPAVFIDPLREQQYPEIRKNYLNVMLAFNNEDENFRFQGNSREQFLQQLAKVIEQLAKTTSLNLILVPHYLDDYKMIYDFFNYLSPQVAHQCVRTTGLVGVPDTRWFYGRYAQADLVLSMRVHAMSPCIGMNVPTIPLVSQDRMTTFLNNVNLQTHAVDIFSHEFAEDLLDKINQVLQNPDAWCQLQQQAVKLMRGQATSFHHKIKTLLRDYCLVS